MERKDKDGTWELHGNVALLTKPSAAFRRKQAKWAAQSVIAEAERAVVQAERDRCVEYLTLHPKTAPAGLASNGFKESTLEMSFLSIIEMFTANKAAAQRQERQRCVEYLEGLTDLSKAKSAGYTDMGQTFASLKAEVKARRDARAAQEELNRLAREAWGALSDEEKYGEVA